MRDVFIFVYSRTTVDIERNKDKMKSERTNERTNEKSTMEKTKNSDKFDWCVYSNEKIAQPGDGGVKNNRE
jgi:hypothetical protein